MGCKDIRYRDSLPWYKFKRVPKKNNYLIQSYGLMWFCKFFFFIRKPKYKHIFKSSGINPVFCSSGLLYMEHRIFLKFFAKGFSQKNLIDSWNKIGHLCTFCKNHEFKFHHYNYRYEKITKRFFV